MAGTLKVGTITTPSGSGNITIPSGVTLLSNTPAFLAHNTANQDISEATDTKVSFGTVPIDTDNAFSDSKFTVPSGKAGKYVFNGVLQTSSVGQSEYQYGVWYVYKNGSAVSQQMADNRNNNLRDISAVFNFMLDLSEGDYIEIYVQLGTSGSSQRIKGQTSFPLTWFSGYRIGA